MSTSTDPNAPTKDNPYASELLVNRLMTEGSDKETRHFELSLKDSGLNYLPGDSLGVVPTNCEEVVGDLLNAVGLSGEETIRIDEESVILKDALMNRLACTVLSKIQIKKFNEIAQAEQLTDLLQIANKDALVDYMWGRELIDLFLEFPQNGMSAQEFVGLLRPMPPRLYSIASSLSAHPGEVHLTVAVVRYEGNGKKRKGYAHPTWLNGWERVFHVIFTPIRILSYLKTLQHRSLWLAQVLESHRFVLLLRRENQLVQLGKTGSSLVIAVKKPIICTVKNGNPIKKMEF